MRVRIPELQYHATSADRVEAVRGVGLRLPTQESDVATHRFRIPSISTADEPKNAAIYHPMGTVFVLRVQPWATYMRPSRARKGESLEDTVNRWLDEAATDGFDGVYVGKGLQSTVGNQTINPKALAVVGVWVPL